MESRVIEIKQKINMPDIQRQIQINSGVSPVLERIRIHLMNEQSNLIDQGYFTLPSYLVTQSSAAASAVHRFYEDLKQETVSRDVLSDSVLMFKSENYSRGTSLYTSEDTIDIAKRIVKLIHAVDPKMVGLFQWGSKVSYKAVISTSLYYADAIYVKKDKK